MRKKYIIIGVLAIVFLIGVGYIFLLSALRGMGNPTGGRPPDYPYFITTAPVTVKKIVFPKGTKLIYEEQFFKEGQQDEMMNENKLTDVNLPEGQTVEWAGVPVSRFTKFFNTEMVGFSVHTDFDKLGAGKRTKFSELLENCGGEMGVLVNDSNDWSFDTNNIVNISDCSVNYQRYFKDDVHQQKFLDSLFGELMKQRKVKQ